jgi:hypothetical protein
MSRQARKGREGKLRNLLLPPWAKPDAPLEMELPKRRTSNSSRLRSGMNLWHWNEEVRAAKKALTTEDLPLVYTAMLIDPIGVRFDELDTLDQSSRSLPRPDASAAHTMIAVGSPTLPEFASILLLSSWSYNALDSSVLVDELSSKAHHQ